jgi:phospholipid/cholesterol/gamma-HCH transport system permease protein
MTTSTPSTHRWQHQGSAWVLQLVGDWSGSAALALQGPPAVAGVAGGSAQAVCVDGQGLSAWDTALTAALCEVLSPFARQGARLDLQGLPHEVRAVLELALRSAAGSNVATSLPTVNAGPALPGTRPGARPTLLAVWGEQVAISGQRALTTVGFFGEVLMALARLLRWRGGVSGLRPRELWRQVDLAGPLSVPIVGLTCFLIGMMLAYMGGAQLDRLGAQRYIADIVTVGMVRELAGLMTGVILAGRIGSAYAAQLATMKAGEEIDALRALGLDPIDHLVLPRVLALVMVAPLVWAYGALVGVLAGLVPTALVYGVPPREYLHQALSALTWTHLWIGVFKCSLYAALLALAGCREGLHAGRNAQAVGEATTTAVVKGLVWIIAAACGSTVVFQSLGL